MGGRSLAICSGVGVCVALLASNIAGFSGASPALAWIAGAAAGGVALLFAAHRFR